jgi:hypothetical protein
VALDQSANSDTASENLTNIIEQLPTGIYPPDEGFISETDPTFDWEDVIDPQSSITYNINVHRHDNGNHIWGVGGLTSSQVVFNFDGSATESLQDGIGYDWDVRADDEFDNNSWWDGNFTVSSGDGPVIINFDFSTGHDQSNYQIDGWANVIDPQGQGDIQTVKMIDADGAELVLRYEGSGNSFEQCC